MCLEWAPLYEKTTAMHLQQERPKEKIAQSKSTMQNSYASWHLLHRLVDKLVGVRCSVISGLSFSKWRDNDDLASLLQREGEPVAYGNLDGLQLGQELDAHKAR